MGYDCRINGPLEKCVKDYKDINDGGDIPEHRIQYFRRKDTQHLSRSFLWDRASRLDKLFGSGVGSEAPLSSVSLQNAQQAERTMKRLAEERAIFAAEKAKRRARQQRAKALAARKLNATMSHSASSSSDEEFPSGGQPNQRHTWHPFGQYHSYDADSSRWTDRMFVKTMKLKTSNLSKKAGGRELKLITWNVLFDLQRNEQNYLVRGDNSLLSDKDDTTTRWTNLIESLADEGADVIALQEVTPRFLDLLLSQEWVQQGYSSTASTSDTKSLQLYGNLTIWKRDSFMALGSYLCRDVGRNRATVVSLRHGRAGVLNVANVHLPADRNGEDRTAARQKELSAVVAKLQVLEQQCHSSGDPCPIPVILGDFNSGDEDVELFPGDVFEDAWKNFQKGNDCASDQGFTFNWKLNRRADKTRQHGHSNRPPRRIDRVHVGRPQGKGAVMPPHGARLLGRNDNQEFPPSDHYGVSISFSILERDPPEGIMYDPIHSSNNVWTTAAIPTTESLLALVLEEGSSSVCNTGLFDATSSLPIPHVTLLNGFVDLSSDDMVRVATQAVADALRQALATDNPTQAWSLPINHSSLTLFEHRSSATMVCVPDTSNKEGAWLNRLYETLRATFPLCHEQESRFVDGWTPHLSMAPFPDASTARDAIGAIRSSNSGWVQEQGPAHCLRAYGLGLFRRDVNDGKFYPVTTVPLSERRHREVCLADTDAFLLDAGQSWSTAMIAASSVILKDLARAGEYANKKLNDGRLEVTVCAYGSHALGVSLPGISDLDTTIQLKPKSTDDDAVLRSMSDSQFLNCVAARLSAIHKGIKTRMRLSSSPNRTALFLLTVKFPQQSPSVDIMLCRTGTDNTPINMIGQSAMRAIQDSDYISTSVRGLQFCSLDVLDGWQVYQGALRIIKLWANRRQIYGTSMGYLGGGGWAALLLWVLQREEEDFSIKANTLVAAAQELATHFFNNVNKLYANSNHVIVISDCIDQGLVQQAAATVASRSSMSVLAPISGGDFGRSTTTATTATIWDEILQAQRKIAAGGIGNLLTSPFELSAALSEHILLLQVEISQGTKPAEIRAWGATRALNLTVTLESEISLRLSSHIQKRGNSFLYSWAARPRGEPAILEQVASKQAMILEQECKHSSFKTKASLSVLSREDYAMKLGAQSE